MQTLLSQRDEGRISTGQRWNHRGYGRLVHSQKRGRGREQHIGGRWVGDALGVGVVWVQSERRAGILAAGGAAGRADVLVDFVGAVVHDPDVADVVGIDGDAGWMRVGGV